MRQRRLSHLAVARGRASERDQRDQATQKPAHGLKAMTRTPDVAVDRVLRLEDGVSFVHVVTEDESVDNPDSLQDVPAFQAFVADIADRCDVPPLAMAATVVGSYRPAAGP